MQIVEPGLGVAVVAPVAEGVLGGDGGVVALGGGGGEDIAVDIVGVFRHGFIGTVEQLHHVALAVDHI